VGAFDDPSEFDVLVGDGEGDVVGDRTTANTDADELNTAGTADLRAAMNDVELSIEVIDVAAERATREAVACDANIS
jgi:hypothetical protein